MLFLSMLVLGGIIGFVGAGGGGVVITLLVVGFGVPIHQALAVALGSMAFTTLSGAVSHYREGEVVPCTGFVIGATRRRTHRRSDFKSYRIRKPQPLHGADARVECIFALPAHLSSGVA